mmetsp:Transcript_56189/g.105347  ORF Transcript_56189/g.105347 Transcript_56189/m.105347 type:complete len:316 (-) Transcript_56189:62-1009(-)
MDSSSMDSLSMDSGLGLAALKAQLLWLIVDGKRSEEDDAGMRTVLEVKNSFLQLESYSPLPRSASFPSVDASRRREQLHRTAQQVYEATGMAETDAVTASTLLRHVLQHFAGAAKAAKAAKDVDAPTGNARTAAPSTSSARVQLPVSPDLRAPLICQTSLMIRNLPFDFTRTSLRNLLQNLGLLEMLNFLYLPLRGKDGASLGYAFLNAVNLGAVAKIVRCLHGMTQPGSASQESRLAIQANIQAPNLPALIAKYRNSGVMHNDVPRSMKPVLLRDGVEIQFPPPTLTLARPEWLRDCLSARVDAGAVEWASSLM